MTGEKKLIDRQLNGLAGEYFVAAQLLKRGMLASVTMGNAKALDLFCYNPDTDRTFNVQVKTLRYVNCFPMKKESIKAGHVYVFVMLNKDGEQEQFFLVQGRTILKDINRFYGSCYTREKPPTVPAINSGSLKPFEDNWKIFDRNIKKSAEQGD